jgi:hypothetical protein
MSPSGSRRPGDAHDVAGASSWSTSAPVVGGQDRSEVGAAIRTRKPFSQSFHGRSISCSLTAVPSRERARIHQTVRIAPVHNLLEEVADPAPIEPLVGGHVEDLSGIRRAISFRCMGSVFLLAYSRTMRVPRCRPPSGKCPFPSVIRTAVPPSDWRRSKARWQMGAGSWGVSPIFVDAASTAMCRQIMQNRVPRIRALSNPEVLRQRELHPLVGRRRTGGELSGGSS